MASILQLGPSIALPDSEDIETRRATVAATLTGPLAAGTVADEAPLGGRSALWIHPATRPAGPIVLYLHGGAFEVGSPTAYQAFCSNLALGLDATIVVPDYRLAPEHPFPAAVDDVLAAYRELLATGRAPSSIALVGDSAGGGLVLSCLLAAQRAGLPQPAAAVGFSSWADLTLRADAHRRCASTDPFVTTAMLRRAAHHYLVDTDARDPLASPVHAPADELAHLAPLLLLAAANEVLADDSSTMARRIADAGGDITLDLYPTAFHAWPLAGDTLPESRTALDHLTHFIQGRWPQ
jgi:acetyl esterase/lipase